MIVLMPTKNQVEKEKHLPKTEGREGGDTQHLIVTVIVTVIPQILNQILTQIHRILIQVLLVMGNTRIGRKIIVGMGRREVLDGSRKEANTVVEDQSTSPKGLNIASL